MIPEYEPHTGAGGSTAAGGGGRTATSSGAQTTEGAAGARAQGSGGAAATSSGATALGSGQGGGGTGAATAGERGAGGNRAAGSGAGGRPATGSSTGGSAAAGRDGGADAGPSAGGGRAAGGGGSALRSDAGASGRNAPGAGGAASRDAGAGASAVGSGGRAATGGSGGRAATGGSGGASGTGTATSNVTIWIAGDSTVANGSTPCPVGWGALFASHFNSRVTVKNSAIGGRSVRTWLYNVQSTMDSSTGECARTMDASGQPTISTGWKTMLDGMKSGDYLFIQFGINDGDTACPRHVGLDAFKTAFGMMAQAAKDRGANPVFLTPVSAIACNGSTARATRGSFVTATQDAGKQYDVPVIDLHDLSIKLYNEKGFCPLQGGDVSASTTGPVGDFFCEDHTHFDRTGATAIAQLVADAVRTLNLGLAGYLQ